LIEAVTFSAGATNNFATRTLQVTLNYGGGSSTVSKSIRVGMMRLTQYQDNADYGYGAYGAETDIELVHATPGAAFPAGTAATTGLFIDTPTSAGTPNECQVLLRFDSLIGTNAGQIPPGSTIVSAELLVDIINTGNGGTLNRILIPWDGTNSMWSSWDDGFGDGGIQVDDVMARSAYDSQLGISVASAATGTGMVSIGVTPDIQAWANGETNYGWLVHGWPFETDGTGFAPSEDPVTDNHPRLRVYWIPAGTSGGVASFRNGDANEYAGTFDTEIQQGLPDANNATVLVDFSDANDFGSANNTESLLRFDGIIGGGVGQVPPNARIDAAFLDVASVTPDAMGDGGRFIAMLQPWQDTNATWNSLGGNGLVNDGAPATAAAFYRVSYP